jgi:predicted amino acid dehydrogenase
MKSFAFIVSPLTIKELKDLWHTIRVFPDFLIRPFLKDHHGFKILEIDKIRSLRGKEIDGYFIISLPFKDNEHPQEEMIIERVISAIHLAEKLEVRIAGLDSVSSLLLNKSYLLGKKVRIPITTGIAFASWSIFEAIYRTVKMRGTQLKNLNLTIIGAESPLGSLCNRKFSDNVKEIILAGEDNSSSTLSNADIIIRLSKSKGDTFNLAELKPGAILCNYNFKEERKGKVDLGNDIVIIDGGQIKLPFGDTISAPLAETMLLTFEERFVNYSKLEEIADIACRHGFEVWVPQAPVL